jgi:hypothetical protein
MLTALILVCSLATISDDCTRDSALDVVYIPATFAARSTESTRPSAALGAGRASVFVPDFNALWR